MAFYDSYNYRHYWKNREYENRAETIALQKLFQLIPQKKKKNILDIGAGFGRHTPLYAPLFKKAILIDPSVKLLSQAQKNLRHHPNLSFKRGEGQKIPLKNQGVDVVLLIRVIHHLENPSSTLGEITRILKPQGFLILEFANKVHFKAKIKAIVHRDWQFFSKIAPSDRRSPKNIKSRSIAFLNYHPQAIKEALQQKGLKIIKKLSVSNFRSPILKKILPLNYLLLLEKITQPLLAPLNFGPSIFILAVPTPSLP